MSLQTFSRARSSPPSQTLVLVQPAPIYMRLFLFLPGPSPWWGLSALNLLPAFWADGVGMQVPGDAAAGPGPALPTLQGSDQRNSWYVSNFKLVCF